MAFGTAAFPAAPFLPDGPFRALLDISLTGVNVLRPLYNATGELEDFAFVYLNPAAQRMTGLGERPGGTTRTHFPAIFTNGVFACYQRAFETGAAGRYDVNYQADGLDNYFRVAAQRSGEWLIVSFTDTSDQDRTSVEVALRESQAREQQARAEAEAQRQRLHGILLQLPAQVATNRGPDHVFDLVNPRYQQQFPARLLQGLPVREALPELVSQQFFELLDQVYQTGEPFYGREMPAAVDYANSGQPELRYFDVFFQALRDTQGHIDGLLNFAYDVTAQVEARRQVEQLNQELEGRVQTRTQELAEQQRLLHQILAQVPAAIATLHGPTHHYTFFNDAYQALSGERTRTGLTVAEVFPEVVEQGFIDLLNQVYTTGQPFRGTETPAQLFDATTGQPEARYVDFIYQPLLDEHGQTTGILAFIVDVTDKVLARQQTAALQAQLLAAAQHQAAERLAFYQIFEQTPALVALLRAPGHRFEYVNPAFQALFPGPLVGRDVVDAAPELAAQGFVALLDRVYQTGETYFGQEVPFTPVPAPGQPARTNYFDFTYQAYRENGEVAGISLIAFDVTGQVLARQERATQQRQLREVFEQAPVAIFVVRGAEYVFEVVNPGMAAIVGRAPDQVLGQRFFDVLPALAEQGYRDLLDQVWHTGQAYVAQEQAAQMPHHRAGETGYYNFNYVPVREAEGRITGIMCVAVDVTSQVQARQQVQRLNEELAATNEALTATNEELNVSNAQLTRTNVDLDTFVYTASHDLKAPITNIEGITLALRETLPADVQQDEMIAHLLDLLEQTTTRFQVTIGQLTDLSKLQLAHAGPAEPVNLAAVVESVRLDLAPVIAAANAHLTVEVAPELVASFSPANLRSAVYNLLSNAVKYRAFDRPAQVRVRAFPAGPRLVLEVQDNGLGMSEVQQRQLFGLFQRLHTHVEGTGVGLYITKRLVENGGGTIAVQSQVDVGTTFTLTFPA